MKKIIKYFSIIILAILLSGCSTINKENKVSVKAPNNNKLEILGVWSVEEYEVLDNNLFNEEEIEKINSNDIIIKSDKIILGKNFYKNSSYKLKLVKNNYVISYEAKYSLDNLNPDSEYTNIYSIMHQNNILGEFIYFSREKSYFYYEGVLFSLKYKKKVDDNDNFHKKKQDLNLKTSVLSNKEQGMLLGLKTPMINENGTYQRETYRTLWISLKDSKVQDVKEKNYILVPRSNGFWKIESKAYKYEDTYHEYFIANPIENEQNSSIVDMYLSDTDDANTIYKKINYVGNDYIAIEEVNNSKYISDFYEVLPIDNVYLNEGVVIKDIYGDGEYFQKYMEENSEVVSNIYNNDINKFYKEAYDSVYKELDNKKKEKLSKYIDYRNFTVVRNKGKWMLQGMISGLNGEESVEYSLGIKANDRLISHDILYIPWKSLKSELPFMEDAYMSPSGRIAIILSKEEILIYLVEDGKLSDEPLRKIPLKDGETAIMAEWCEKDYVDKWGSMFKDDTIIK